MTRTPESDDEPLDPAQVRVVRRLRGLMLFSGLIMVGGFIVVFGVIAYRLSAGTERGKSAESNVSLPKGARVVATAVSGDKLLITIEIAGATEVRIYDLATLEPRGRLTIKTEP
jgi:hypothetical protein